MSEYLRVLPQIAELPFYPAIRSRRWHNFYGFCVLLFANLFSRRDVELLAVLLMVGGITDGRRLVANRTVATVNSSVEFNPVASTLALGLLISPDLMVYDLMVLLLPSRSFYATYPTASNEHLLEAGPLLVWSALVYAFVFVSTYSMSFMLQATTSLGLPKLAIQLSVLITIAWAVIGHFAAVSAKRGTLAC